MGDEVLPLLLHRPFGNLRIERDAHDPSTSVSSSTQHVIASGSNSMIPACTAIGIDTLPTTTTVARPAARPWRHELNRGLLQPSDWNSDHVPWNRWMPRAMLASDVEDRHRQAGQRRVEVAVDRPADEVRVGETPREVGEVPEQEQHDDDAGPAHRAAGEVGHLVVTGGLVLDRAGLAVEDRQRVRGVDVEDDGTDQQRVASPTGSRSGAGAARAGRGGTRRRCRCRRPARRLR